MVSEVSKRAHDFYRGPHFLSKLTSLFTRLNCLLKLQTTCRAKPVS